jgi:Brp/Blh family beta-carotene 15,15'-monooxygenase
MMNFNIEQSNYTQFIYILPFSNNEALVELTRFGVDKIDTDYAKIILDKFLSQSFGEYSIVGDETGCIPMTTFRNSGSQFEGVLNTGASANMIKPSTGYGFKKMFEYAEVVSDKILAGDFEHFNKMPLQSKSRFLFYDRLLLIILLYWPSEGKKIFTRLFKRHRILTIFQFLDEKTTLYQEIKIFMSLPIIPFLRALYKFAKTRNYLRYIVAIFFVFIYLISVKIDNSLGLFVNYSTLISGLLLFGIPHGALDYLLSDNHKTSLLSFIVKYLSIIAAYLFLWWFLPSISLIVFLVFSCFHFGESEMEETGDSLNSTLSFLNAFFLGLSILCCIIFTHLNESLSIINYMIDLTDKSITIIHANATLIAALSFVFIIAQSFYSRKIIHWGLLLLLLLGSLVPLIAAFGLYFIFQHSINAWGHLKDGLSTNNISLYKKALPYTIGAVLFFMVIVILYNKFRIDYENLIPLFFIFLACISLPHVILMHSFYLNKIKKIE